MYLKRTRDSMRIARAAAVSGAGDLHPDLARDWQRRPPALRSISWPSASGALIIARRSTFSSANFCARS
jgi:hypothetical protein